MVQQWYFLCEYNLFWFTSMGANRLIMLILQTSVWISQWHTHSIWLHFDLNCLVIAVRHFNLSPHSAAYVRYLNRFSIGSDNGLSPIRCQAIIYTNAGLLLIGPLGTNFSEILIKIQNFWFTKMHLKISSAKWQPFCPGGEMRMFKHPWSLAGSFIQW